MKVVYDISELQVGALYRSSEVPEGLWRWYVTEIDMERRKVKLQDFTIERPEDISISYEYVEDLSLHSGWIVEKEAKIIKNKPQSLK